MEYFKKIETMVIWTVIILLGIAYGVLSNKADAPATAENTQPVVIQNQPETTTNTEIPHVASATTVSYQGEEGKSAMSLLKANYQVETQSFGNLGEFVKSINGIQPDSTHFWALYVNGSISQVGADAYITKPTDIIEWKLEKIQ